MLEPGLETAHLVLLGYGGAGASSDALARGARFGGRIHVLDAVPPDDLLDWIATADVDAIPLQRPTLNHRLCTPNKLFESIAAGVPVVGERLPGDARDRRGRPGRAARRRLRPRRARRRSRRPSARSSTCREERATLRARCAEAAAERWNWETESKALLAAYEGMAPPAAS